MFKKFIIGFMEWFALSFCICASACAITTIFGVSEIEAAKKMIGLLGSFGLMFALNGGILAVKFNVSLSAILNKKYNKEDECV